MGYLNALGMAAATDLRTALGWHLQSNHYPPVPAQMVPVAERAVKAAREEHDEDLDGQDEYLAYERGVGRGQEDN